MKVRVCKLSAFNHPEQETIEVVETFEFSTDDSLILISLNEMEKGLQIIPDPIHGSMIYVKAPDYILYSGEVENPENTRRVIMPVGNELKGRELHAFMEIGSSK